jgi:hypothetical protein
MKPLLPLLKRHKILWIGPLFWLVLALAAVLYQALDTDAPFSYSLF